MANILLLCFAPDSLPEGTVETVRSLCAPMRVEVTRDRAEIERLLPDIEIAAGQFPHDLITNAPKVRWIQQWGAGADWLLRHPEAAAAPFVLTNASGVHAVPISEHILAYLLAFARGLPQAQRDQLQARWSPVQGRDLLELAGSTLLLVGVGAIGARTARLAAAFDMRVVGVRRDPSIRVDGVTEMRGLSDLPDLLREADYVVLTVPLTRETRGLIGASELRSMKQSAYLVNIGRGGTVREGDLVRALQEGWIAGAGLDVFEEEPLPADSPLWGMDNVIVTSHYSGATPRYHERAFAIFVDNLKRYMAGQPLKNVVDKSLGY